MELRTRAHEKDRAWLPIRPSPDRTSERSYSEPTTRSSSVPLGVVAGCGPYRYCIWSLLFVKAAAQTCLLEKISSLAFRSPVVKGSFRREGSAGFLNDSENFGSKKLCRMEGERMNESREIVNVNGGTRPKYECEYQHKAYRSLALGLNVNMGIGLCM